MNIVQRISRFMDTLSGNLLAADDFIDWDAVSKSLSLRAKDIDDLQEIINTGPLSRYLLREVLDNHPSTYFILLDLLAFSSSGTQVEKWGLPSKVSPARLDWLVDQLLYVGIAQVLPRGANIAALLKVAEVYKDANRRRFRGGRKLDDRVSAIVHAEVREASKQLGVQLSYDHTSLVDPGLRRALSFVITLNKRPIAGITSVFQNQAGGRQARDLSITYPFLQQRLSDHGMALILIADGQGVKEASDRTLGLLFEGVKYPVSLVQAASGAISEALVEAAMSDKVEPLDQTALNRLIDERLKISSAINAEILPVGHNRARLALSAYADGKKDLFLSLSPSGDKLSWGNIDWIETARRLKLLFDPKVALALFSEMLECEIKALDDSSSGVFAEISAPPVAPFSETLHVTSCVTPLDATQARNVGRRSSEMTPYSNVAVYITQQSLSDNAIAQHRRDQSMLAANVICISAATLEQMAASQHPIEPLIDQVLIQSDLTKVSPFILSNPTTARMFYGREAEAATVQRTLSTNSVAILGSRRIGKTSLIRRLRDNLQASNFQPYFADCQTVKTWSDFAQLAQRAWKVTLPTDFTPLHLSDLIEQLQGRGSGPLVIILDEIDQLIEWDQTHSEDSVPEAFFRSCRSISQSGFAQFVFSGERRIANRLWDAQSPHWNFCRAVQLTQLNAADAISLLVDPLKSMNIKLPDQQQAVDLAWERTSGHPQIVQYLGDRLVKRLNARQDRRDLAVSADDIREVTSTSEYAQHYLATYWGQSTKFEKIVSEIIAASDCTPVDVVDKLKKLGIHVETDDVLGALRMLQLYGIITDVDKKIRLRATWFPSALAQFGNLSVI